MPLTANMNPFITCAVTGSGGTQDRSPHVPRSPEQIAARGATTLPPVSVPAPAPASAPAPAPAPGRRPGKRQHSQPQGASRRVAPKGPASMTPSAPHAVARASTVETTRWASRAPSGHLQLVPEAAAADGICPPLVVHQNSPRTPEPAEGMPGMPGMAGVPRLPTVPAASPQSSSLPTVPSVSRSLPSLDGLGLGIQSAKSTCTNSVKI